MTLVFQQILNGLVVGSIYTLVALGMTLIQGTIRIPNIAHGSLYMVAAYIIYTLTHTLGLSYWVAVAVAIAVMPVLGIIVERIYWPVRQKGTGISLFVAGIGILVLLNNSVRLIYGAQWKYVRGPLTGTVDVFGLIVTRQRILIIVAAIVSIALLNLFLNKTLIGSTIQAVAQNPSGASLVGINIRTTSMLTFGIATALAGLAAALIAPVFLVYYEMGTPVVLRAMAILVVGGLGSVAGAIVGGYILGLAEAMSVLFMPAGYQDLIAFGLLIAILTFKPTGLFGREL
ncbi:MAG: branched-chain amino acid ABC transporter permease [Dethiobacter sp.]|nr:branched-chain amino acid ABC transporter permease [Dethiobacter sp.]